MSRIHSTPRAVLAVATMFCMLGCQPGTDPANGTDADAASTAAATDDNAAATTTPQNAPALMAPGEPASTPPTDANAAGDMDFYRQALSSGIAEVALSELARTKASSGKVKEFAAMLVRDHSAVNDRLRNASAMAGDPPPANPEKEVQLRAMSGEAFDRAWLDHMAEGHAKSIALYETTSTRGATEQARTLATETLPKLREHAAHIERLRDGGGGDNASADATN